MFSVGATLTACGVVLVLLSGLFRLLLPRSEVVARSIKRRAQRAKLIERLEGHRRA